MLVLLLLAAFAAALAEPAQIVGNWSLYHFERSCGDSSCLYNFVIDETGNSATATVCSFTVVAANDRFANQTDFVYTRCNGLDNYSISGGWDSRGFITLTVINTAENYNAFFGFNDVDIENNKIVDNLSRPAYVVGTFSTNDVAQLDIMLLGLPTTNRVVPRRLKRSEVVMKASRTWAVVQVARYRNSATDQFILEFDVKDSYDGYATSHCKIAYAYGSSNADATKSSFYKVPCQDNNNYTVSWDYVDAIDGGVLTLCGPDKKSKAWFGWDQVNSHASLSDNGPSKVHESFCG